MADGGAWRADLEHILREGKAELNLYNFALGYEGATEVAARLIASSGNAAEVLNVEENAISDAGAAAIAEFLRSDPPDLEHICLSFNKIGAEGIAVLSDALRVNTNLRWLHLGQNPGVDGSHPNSSDAEAAAGIAALVSAIGVNTTLMTVSVDGLMGNPHQKTVDAALGDTEGRHRGREKFLAGPDPVTKAARKSD
jgi:Leucine Rich repeat